MNYRLIDRSSTMKSCFMGGTGGGNGEERDPPVEKN